jgi:dihydroorotate dehydrogenase
VIDLLYRATKPALFRADPEYVHDRVIATLALVSRSSKACALLREPDQPRDPRLAVDIAGLSLPGPVGVAAGLDKNGVAFPALHALGWDFVEVGTITPNPYTGNPRPRIFRLPEDEALINRMGFPGAGADAIAMNLVQRRDARVPLGCNIGPNKSSVESGLDAVIGDCRLLLKRFASLADYLVVNISSPNTARLRELQGKHALRQLLADVHAALPAQRQTPLFVKIAPDLADSEISDVVGVVMDVGLSGIVATNTTIARPPSLRNAARLETGGLSGAPLRSRSLEVIARIARESSDSIPIMAVGGIASGADAIEAFKAGASAIQIYTGMIYQGPGLARKIKRELSAELDRIGATALIDLRSSAT